MQVCFPGGRHAPQEGSERESEGCGSGGQLSPPGRWYRAVAWGKSEIEAHAYGVGATDHVIQGANRREPARSDRGILVEDISDRGKQGKIPGQIVRTVEVVIGAA